MTGTIDSFTLISIIVLLVIVFKLRSVLGRHNSDDERRIRAKLEDGERAAAKTSEKVVTLPRRNREEPVPQPAPAADSEIEERIKTFARKDDAVQRGLLDIARVDTAFDPTLFMQGARAAYEMIVTAFAEGDRKTLRDLLAPKVLEDFIDAMDDRDRRGERIEQKFIGINRADILQAEVSRGTALITVRFDSQLTKLVYDKTGALIDGSPDKVLTPTDIFTFSRDISSAEARSNLNWQLIETSTSN